MKRLFSGLLATMMVLCLSSVIAFGTQSGPSLDDVLNGDTSSSSSQAESSSSNASSSEESSKAQEKDTEKEKDKEKEKAERDEKNSNFIDGLNQAADLSADVEGVAEVMSPIKVGIAWVVQCLSYIIILALAIKVLLDVAYIGLPFCRSFLANGYQGNPQAGAEGMPNSMVGGMNAGGFGMGNRYGNRYNGMGGMGMNGMGMGGMPGVGGVGGVGGMNTPATNQAGTVLGRIQWVSNAALNAVAGESTVGPDGKANKPFKTYSKDMVIVLVTVPILITLAVTGTLTSLGFLIAELLVDAIAGIGNML